MKEHQKEDIRPTEQLIEQHRQQSKAKLRDFITEVIASRETAFRRKLDELSSVAESGNLDVLSDALQSQKIPEQEKDWLPRIHSLFSDIPASLDLPQAENHFLPDSSDSVWVKIQKEVKRLSRNLSKGFIRVQNVIHNVWKKERVEWSYPTRTIPFQNLMMLASIDLLETLRDFERLLLRHNALIYEKVFRLYVRPPETGIENQDDLNTIFDQLKIGFDTDLNQFKSDTEKQLNQIDTIISDMIAKAGTVELRNIRLTADDIQQKAISITRRYTPLLKQWAQCNELLKERVGTMAHSIELNGLMARKEEKVTRIIDSFFSGFRNKPQARLKELLDEARESLTSSGIPSPRELKTKSEEIADTVAEQVRESVLHTLFTAINESLLTEAINTYAEDLLELTEQQPERVVLSEHTNLTEKAPTFEEVRVEWQRAVHIMCADIIASELLSDSFDPEQDLKAISSIFDEVAQIIETNLKLVEEITHDEDKKPADIALDGVNRAISKFEAAAEAIETMQHSLLEEITGKREAFRAELMKLLNKDDFGNETWVQTQLRVKESAGDWKVKWTVAWAGLVDRIDLLARFISRKYRTWSQKIRAFLGNDKTEGLKSERINLATFLHETDQIFKNLPFIYRRLFDYKRPIDANLYVREPYHFEQVKKAFALWKDEFPSCLAICGEVGSGKKTLVAFLEDEILEGEKFHIRFSQTTWKVDAVLLQLSNALGLAPVANEAELIEQIRSKRNGSTVIIENLHNCYVRAMSGYSGLRLLLSIIAETRKEIFWVVTCYQYCWNFLQVYLNIADHFTHTISTDQLTTEEIRNLIMKRQKASGYAYRFLPTAETEVSRTFKKLLDDDHGQQKYLADKYFEHLSDLADGNATVAIIYWVRSIVEFSEHEVQLRTLNKNSMELISSLDANVLFAILAYLLHGSLSTEELSLCLNASLDESEMIVSRLNTNGLLVEKNGMYALNLLIYRQVVRVLKSKNMLH